MSVIVNDVLNFIITHSIIEPILSKSKEKFFPYSLFLRGLTLSIIILIYFIVISLKTTKFVTEIGTAS